MAAEDAATGSAGRTGPPVAGVRADAARRKRRAQVFGEVLPEATSDDRGDAWGDREGDAEEWLRRQVPPHHG
jgi:hypothetical protein